MITFCATAREIVAGWTNDEIAHSVKRLMDGNSMLEDDVVEYLFEEVLRRSHAAKA